VISRIIEASKAGGCERLQSAVVNESLRPLIEKLCASANLDARRIYRMALASNTTMNHLLLGLYADPVRREPYIPSFFFAGDLRASILPLGLHAEAKLLLAPNIGSYVGGDIAAGVFASMLWKQEELSLLMDLGTNGELVLGNREFLMSCACSAGPAFEGGGLSCGMRATEGAIDGCTIDTDTMMPTYSILGNAKSPRGICGSGIIDIVAELFRAGIINGRGKFIREGERIRRDEAGMGSYLLSPEGNLRITEADIDSFIRAKGAIFAALETMLSAIGMDASMLQHIYVAGGIGSGLHWQNAIAIGMLPNLPTERFTYIGNSSLSGAYAMLLSDAAQEKIDELARSITYVELSTEPGYMDAFGAACFLPNTEDI
jgi:uncharacterized 2Fe-2S/4Fe-4S cluster protein (DUF4445 family)